MKKNKMGIMGGTFDPIHIGHLILAEEAKEYFNLDKIIFIPTGNPPHKEWDNIADSINRYEMVLLATNNNPDFIVSPIEINRDGTTYTIDTIKYLLRQYKNTQFYFITGADSIVQLPEWKNAEELLSLCKFVTAKRIDISNQKLERSIDQIKEKFDANIEILPISYIDISSTNIRNKVKKGESIQYYVSPDVENYILKNKLYID